jgi:hypothetical protein
MSAVMPVMPRPSVAIPSSPQPVNAPVDAPVDANVYLLSDHLDAALAMAEDLLTEKVLLYPATPGTGEAALLRQQAELSAFVSDVYRLELGLTARLLQARKRIADLRKTETRFKPFFSLFVGGTAVLADAADDIAAAAQNSPMPLAFLKQRGLIASDAVRLPEGVTLGVTEDYLIAGAIPLGILMDMLASFLDGLDLVFDLYPREAEGPDTSTPAVDTAGVVKAALSVA